MGGWNSEKEVSMRSGEAVYDALIRLGYRACKINFSRNIFTDLQKIKPDIVFNALHGKFGEDGCVQGMLDILNIPYTHSGLLACAICMDKTLSAKMAKCFNINIPKAAILEKNNLQNETIIAEIGKPFVIKPVCDGSSVGVEVILENDDFNIKKYEWKFGDKMIIEKYIAGQEIQVAVMDGKALGAIEVRPKKLFYDYECKYTTGMTEYVMPAEISKEKYDEVLKIATKIHEYFGCEGISRIDFILNNKNSGDNQFYFLETNTHPGFTATSLVPKIAKYVGISFENIVEYLIKSAKCKS